MFGWACCLPVLKRLVPLPALVRLVRPADARRASILAPDERIAAFARWSCRITAWPTAGNCLERGLLMYRYFALADAHPSLVVGFGRGDNGDVRGHAWVVVHGRPIGESDASVSEFKTAFTFDPDGRLCPTAR